MRMVRLVLLLAALLATGVARAFDPVTTMVAVGLVESVGLPVAYCLSCGLALSPPIRAFGNDVAVYGLDWGSLACHAGSVYGMQLSLCGGSFERRLYGLQLGVLASGYAVEELPFGDYHFAYLDSCRLYGLQYGTFAAKTSTAWGCQLSCVYAQARTVNGLQVALVNVAERLRGLQVGLCNSSETGCGLQVGLLNRTSSGLAGCLPVINFVY